MSAGFSFNFHGKTFRLLLVFTVLGTILATSNFIYGLLTATRTIGSHGSIKAIGVSVYWDSSCTNEVSSVDWGMVEPGSSTSVTVYIKNTGNSPVTLTLDTENWNPSSASNYMSLSWDYNGQSIDAGGVVQVELTLTVYSNVTGITDFSFDIVITGSG